MYRFLYILALFATCHSQYQENDQERYPTRPPPQILTHKQALNHDGNFKYLFTSENGLAQGESIAPDGTRTGGYSYTDPNGKKISVKYTAGKEGFKILEADHLPKAPQPVAPLPAPQQQPQAAYSQPRHQQGSQYDDGSYRPDEYSRPQAQSGAAQSYYFPKTYTQANPQPQPRPAAYQQQPQFQYPQLQARPAPLSNELGDKEPHYDDAPGKPYSFGTGYLFEFGSG